MTGSASPVDGMARVIIGPVAATGGAAGAAGEGVGAPSRLQPASGASTRPVAAREAAERNSRRDVMAEPPGGSGRRHRPGGHGQGCDRRAQLGTGAGRAPSGAPRAYLAPASAAPILAGLSIRGIPPH